MVSNQKDAEHYLTYIGYYRLGPYLQFFQAERTTHTFKEGTTFEDALRLYVFDRELRLLVMDAIERIEVAVRTTLSNHMSIKYGAHWYLDSKHFRPVFDHAAFIQSIKEDTGFEQVSIHPRRTAYLNHYYSKYNDPELPPSWMVVEAMSISTWSRVYANLNLSEDQKKISRRFQIVPLYFESWLHAITYLRNICAHHQLLWNCKFVIQPGTLEIDGACVPPQAKFYPFAVMIQKFMRLISPGSAWAARLLELFKANPTVPIDVMGFPKDWHQAPFWMIMPKTVVTVVKPLPSGSTGDEGIKPG